MNQKPTSPGGVRDLGTLRTLIGYLAPHGNREIAVRITLAMIFLITAKVATVYVPVLYKEAVDILDKPVGGIVVVPVMLIVAYGMVRLASATFAELRDFVFAKVGQRAIRTVALETFRHLHRLSLRFHLERQTGGLSRAIERGTKGIDFLLTFMLFNILPTLIEIIMVAGVLWWLYDIWYAVVTLTTIGAYIAFTLVVTEWRMKFRRTMNESDSEANTKAIDSLLNYETVKYFGNERHEAERFDDALKRFEHAGVRSKTSLSLVNVGQGGIIAVGLITVMLMAGYGIRNGEMTVGDFVLVNTYLIQLYLPLNFLGFVYREIKQSLVDMESMFQLLDIAAEVRDPPDAPPLDVSKAGVSFKDVRFGYDARRPILKGVSFDVPPGRTVAIVGHSGAGKSTISRLLFRFYDLDSGDIEIDGQDISKVTQDSLRSAIGIVPQDTVLFNDTIFYNIRYGRPEASREEVEEAARMAQIHDFVSGLPEGYETMVGERGLKLSGGEKQRVAIARTLLKRPRIFLFDEATSALDSNTEKEIQASLFEVSRDVTTLVIAHRLSTIVDADEIIVLDSGEVVERGRHAELVALGGHYAEMWRRQQESRDAGIPIERGPSARALGETTPAGG